MHDDILEILVFFPRPFPLYTRYKVKQLFVDHLKPEMGRAVGEKVEKSI